MVSVVLVRPQTPENIGFIARCMANFDLAQLTIVSPECDLKDEAVLKTGKHAKKVLAKIKTAETLSSLRSRFSLLAGTTSVLGTDFNIPRTPVAVEDFAAKLGREKAAIVFGNEGTGLTNEELDMCDFVIAIPTSKKYPAMNISHAAAIIFYELYMARGKNKLNSHITPAGRKEKEKIMELMAQVLQDTEFATQQKRQTQLITWRRLFEKSMMSRRESFVVMGLLRKLSTREVE